MMLRTSTIRFLATVMLLVVASTSCRAHGWQILVPFAGDIVLMLAVIALMLRPRATWKYRLAMLLGTVLVIWLSWIIVDISMPGYYFALLDNLPLMTIAYWALVAILFVPLYRWTGKRFLRVTPPTSDHEHGAA